MITLFVVLASFQTFSSETAGVRLVQSQDKPSQDAFQAVRSNDVKGLTDFFQAGGDVNAKNARGDTLLIVSVYNGKVEMVTEILKQKKLTIDATNKSGLTALHAAAFKGEMESAKLLIAAKANVNAADPKGQTPLMVAAQAGTIKLVKLLVESGAKIDSKDSDGKTAIAIANERKDMDMVAYLTSKR